ncbi:ribosome maturation factor RimM [Granulicella aggregans]|uniref:ribosome maturation factor RimM n=1 Tax=Granulicella aggregans TaxID=474949 RepID=UPI0021E01D7A|nr:ribosome maturation factor RimM [Granulicella aggregans]
MARNRPDSLKVIVKPGDPHRDPHFSTPEPASSQNSDQTTQDPQWIVLAHLLRPQGRKGEVLADLLTDFPEQFSSSPRVFLAPEHFTGTESQARVAEVRDFWLPVGKNSGRIVLHLAGIDSINQAEALGGLDVIVPASELPELEDDAEYISDLVGCTLFDHANPEVTLALGAVTDVHFTTTPDGCRRLEEAAPLLVVETPSGDEILVPFVKAFLISVDTDAKRIDMNLPAGLADSQKS